MPLRHLLLMLIWLCLTLAPATASLHPMTSEHMACAACPEEMPTQDTACEAMAGCCAPLAVLAPVARRAVLPTRPRHMAPPARSPLSRSPALDPPPPRV